MQTAIDRQHYGQQLAITKAGIDWQSEALSALRAYLVIRGDGAEFTLEDFRVWAESTGVIFPPASINAWGSVPKAAVRAGICRPTGKVKKAQRPESHARLIRVWEAA